MKTTTISLLLSVILSSAGIIRAAGISSREKVDRLYGKPGGVVVRAGGVDVCSWDYARRKLPPRPLAPFHADLSDPYCPRLPSAAEALRLGRLPGPALF